MAAPPEEITRHRAQTLRAAARLSVAQAEDGACPTVEELFIDGYVHDEFEATDGWGNPYWIECRGGEVVVRSCGFDGENILAACEARTP